MVVEPGRRTLQIRYPVKITTPGARTTSLMGNPHAHCTLRTDQFLGQNVWICSRPRVAKSDLNSTEAYFATKNQHQKMAQKNLKLPNIAQK